MNIRDNAESRTKEYSHTISMLQQLKKLWYKIWLLSNSSVFAVEQIKKKTSILDYIDYPLFSFDVWVIKPDISFFKKMLNTTNCKPEEAIMIWDKLNDDILPPRQIWMNSILFENYDQLKKDISSFWIMLQ
jgi:FMN phosphatase YigB (HAD superfamily)